MDWLGALGGDWRVEELLELFELLELLEEFDEELEEEPDEPGRASSHRTTSSCPTTFPSP